MNQLVISAVPQKVLAVILALTLAACAHNAPSEAVINKALNANQEAVMQVMQKYISGTKTGDVNLLKTIFHPSAMMAGYMGPDKLSGGPEPFFQALENQPPDDTFRAAYKSDIRSLEVSNTVARVTLEEQGFYGKRFINHFHLLKDDGVWLITSKLFEVLE